MNSKTSWEAFDEDEWPEEPPTGVRTPPPPFDLVAFAKDSESQIRAVVEASKRPTAPPPAFHPSRNPSAPRLPGVEALPPSIEAALLDCARRARVARDELRVGGMSREEAARALRAELERIEERGASATAPALRATASALGEVIAELAGVTEDVRTEVHVLVLEDDMTLRDRVTVAAEALGFQVRAAAGFEALTELVAHATPSAVLVGGGASKGWDVLRGILPLDGIPLIVGGRDGGAALEAIVLAAGADDYVRFDLPLRELIEELRAIFTALGVGIQGPLTLP